VEIDAFLPFKIVSGGDRALVADIAIEKRWNLRALSGASYHSKTSASTANALLNADCVGRLD